MSQEILLTLISAGSAAFALGLNKLVAIIVRSRAEKQKEKAGADESILDVERKRVDTSKIKDQAIKDLVNDTYLWIDQMNEALSDMRTKNLRLEAAVFELTRRAEQAERMRDWYRSMLKKLIDIVVHRCPDVDIDEYTDALEQEETDKQ